MTSKIAIIGSTGAIGRALVSELATSKPECLIYAFSRTKLNFSYVNVVSCEIDYQSENSIEDSATMASKEGPLDLVIVATGILHDKKITPEKSLQDLSAEKLHHLFSVNTVFPALVAKHFIPKLNRQGRSIFAALSARVGSISDNEIGGWYSYRASKAALNMIIKNASIETKRKNKESIIIGLHPGTVASNLSKPFQGQVAEGKLFTPEYSAKKLLEVLDIMKAQNSGKCYAWDGGEIAF